MIQSQELLKNALIKTTADLESYYLWLEKSMPRSFSEEISHENRLLITHSLMGFNLQDYFSTINLKSAAIVLCLDGPDADLRILKNFPLFAIKHYQTYTSNGPAPFSGIEQPIRIAFIGFSEGTESKTETPLSNDTLDLLESELKNRNPEIPENSIKLLLSKIGARFLQSLSTHHLITVLDKLYRAKDQDNCQYEIEYETDWAAKNSASMNIILAWKHIPKYDFLYKLAQVIHRHDLIIKKVNASYIDPFSNQDILVMSLSLHGSNGKPVWDVADIPDFMRELVTLKYFDESDLIEELLVSKKIISGNRAHLLRALTTFIHQALIHIDANLYRLDNIVEAICRHPDLTVQLCRCFTLKFDPKKADNIEFKKAKEAFLSEVNKLDTGQGENDHRRKTVLLQGMNFIEHTLKTNFYRQNYTALSFRLDPRYLDFLPFDRSIKFPELPYAIFFIKGWQFFAFHIRFKDLARGGLRTVLPENIELAATERNNVFSECYHLALTQQKKNKDIPEGGAKGLIFLEPFEGVNTEIAILKKELEWLKEPSSQIENRLAEYKKEYKIEHLYQAQRSFIESLITIVNCDPDGTLRAKHIIDYWKKPEYIYLGPDENMHNSMIEWIALFSQKYDYKPGRSFISSKPIGGINHKEYGVTSLGVNVYMHEALKFIGIDPDREVFSVKITGGPDGDVAGNQLLNLYRFYPSTAKVKTIIDGTGLIYDPEGLDLSLIKNLFYNSQGIRFYPPEKISEGSFLLDRSSKRYQSAYIQETLCWRKINGKLVDDWLSGSDMNQLTRYHLHKTTTDVFIPAGGRPRTLNENNITDFMNNEGKPSSKIIVEGANLYLTPKARTLLEDLGVIIFKDSSANKGGVICSSFEVLCGLTLNENLFLENKSQLVIEILDHLQRCAYNEAQLLLNTHKKTGKPLTLLSDRVSHQINLYKYQLLDYLDTVDLFDKQHSTLLTYFFNYCLPTLREHYQEQLLKEIPDHHKKAIIACFLATELVYKKGVEWSPSVIDILPLISTIF
jgi:glutamate dehydrogenase